jgi:integrase/recombinase XerC/integrase/recombinase XerD
LLANYKNVTTVHTLKLVNAFFAWAVEHRYIPDNPVEFIDRPAATKAPIKWLTTEEQNAVIREARRIPCGLDKSPTDNQRAAQIREYAIVLTFLRAGLRVEELCDLRIADLTITPRKGFLYVKGKGDKDRTIPLCKELRNTLTRYLDTRKDNPSPFVFPSQRSEQSTTRAIQHLIEGYADRLKMPHLSCHTLRHTFGHDLAVKHVSLDVIARLMGHCKKDGSPNIAMTMRYTSPGLSDLENAVELIAWN